MHSWHLKIPTQCCMLYASCTLSFLLLTLQTAAAKGLIAGSITVHREDGTHVDGMNDKEVHLMRQSSEYELIAVGHACS